MDYRMCIATDLIGVLLLMLILFDFGAPSPRGRDFANRMFRAMLWTNAALLVTDAVTWCVMGVDTPCARWLLPGSMFVYYLLHGPMCFFWSLYCDYKLYEDMGRIRRLWPVLTIPVLILTALLVANLKFPVIYRITAQNGYVREPLYPLSIALCLPHYLYSAVITLKRMRGRGRFSSSGPARYLLLYPIFPLLFVVIQSFSYGLAIVWMGSVISLLIIYFNLQNAKITTDALTGISNRHRFESYMGYKLRNRTDGLLLFVLMIDIDDFKAINDRQGHLMGDTALRITAQQILAGVRRSDFVARIGGDEFVVVGECPQEGDVTHIVQSIHQKVACQTKCPLQLSVSIGSSLLPSNQTRSIDDLLLEADRAMYAQKSMHHGCCAD